MSSRIDPETVRRILDTADIFDVVSDFVKLRRSGANYKGLWPFHDERTPSFSVNKARNICKCFSCGKGGSPVNFIMEHEQLSYNEALRYLARKYNIEIIERELNDAERQAASDREAMLAVNEFALNHFEHNLTETEDGRNIALSYFRHRGINDAMIKRFHLGYALERSDALYSTAKSRGFTDHYLESTGLCLKSERTNSYYDRFKGRVIFPIHSVAGRVLGFGGRTMRSDKTVAKYVNSPESTVYVKNRELYGLYQAKSAIAKKDKCILVEGYMDVISMHQAGVENVVASSGTSLTQGQIRALRRFSSNVTLIYDSDAAGIKASLRGINLLLAENLTVKVLLLPEGDDPDSFAQSHSASEVEAYLKDHETDIIAFMIEILMRDVSKSDPIARAKVANTILQSVAMVSDQVLRMEYIGECARRLGLSENVVALQLQKFSAVRAEELEKEMRRQQARDSVRDIIPENGENTGKTDENATPDNIRQESIATAVPDRNLVRAGSNTLLPYERMIMRYVTRYGLTYFCDLADADGNLQPGTVVDYVVADLSMDDIHISDPALSSVLEAVKKLRSDSWPDDRKSIEKEAGEERRRRIEAGHDEIRQVATDIYDIEKRERELAAEADAAYDERLRAFDTDYLQRRLLSSDDDTVRLISTDLISERYVLSKIHTKFAHVESEEEQLSALVPRAIYELKAAILAGYIDDTKRRLAAVSPSDTETFEKLLRTIVEYQELQKEFAKTMGERIILPKHS